MKRQFFVLLFLALAAHGQMQDRVAILNTLDDSESVSISETAYLTDRLREVAADVLPKQRYGIMTTESIVAFLGSQENAVRVCKAASCIAEIGRKVNADFVAQGRIRKFGELLSMNFELYNTRSGVLVGSFNGNSKDVYGFIAIIDEKAPALFRELESQKIHAINLITEPPGAALSINGESSAICPQTPCKTELRDGDEIHITAKLNWYETADTTVKITANTQTIAMRLKSVPIVYEEAAQPSPSTNYTMVAVALDIAGIALVTAGIVANANMQSSLNKYGKSRQSQGDYDDAWKDAQSSHSNRNVLYVVGGLVLASGIGVHIWF